MLNLRAKLVGLCMVDEHGVRVFSDNDFDAVGGKSGLVLDRLFMVAQRINGLSNSEVETLTKNSEAAPRGDSISA